MPLYRTGEKYRTQSFTHNSAVERYIWERDESKCVYCGAPAQIIDHVVPTKAGGKTIKENGVCACTSCNYKKRWAKGTDLEIKLYARAIFWLLQKGEDMSWLDKL